MKKRRSLAAIGAVMMSVVPHTILAQGPRFEAELRQYDGSNLICGFGIDAEAISFEPVGCAVDAVRSGATGSGTVSMKVLAGRGWVQTGLDTAVNANPAFSGFGYGGCAKVATSIDDILISGPAGPATAGLTVDISGEIAGDTPRDTNPVVLRVLLSSYNAVGGSRDADQAEYRVSVPEMADTTLSVGPVNVEAGDTLTVELRIDTTVGLFANNTAPSKSLDIDFLNRDSTYGISFSRTGSVFDLPAGFTANSLDGDIANNQWLSEPIPLLNDGLECGGQSLWEFVQ